MEVLFTTLGALFFVFLVLSAATESVLEAFRGGLEALGFTFLKGKVSLEDALKLSSEFAAGNSALQAKAEAIKTVASQLGSSAKIVDGGVIQELERLKKAAGGAEEANSTVAAELSGLAAKVKSEVDEIEGRRVLLLRFISMLIGGAVTALSGVQILEVVAALPAGAKFVQIYSFLNTTTVNIIIGGLAASVGSSYWHDQLDRVRKVKDVSQQLTAVVKQQ